MNITVLTHVEREGDDTYDVVVGQDIDEISVSRVAGSSLTSGGFNRAIEEIKAEAAG